MKAGIDKAGRIVIPSEIRRRAGWEAGTELDVVIEDDGSVRLARDVPGPRLQKVGRRLIARPAARKGARPQVDVAAFIEEERGRWPW